MIDGIWIYFMIYAALLINILFGVLNWMRHNRLVKILQDAEVEEEEIQDDQEEQEMPTELVKNV